MPDQTKGWASHNYGRLETLALSGMVKRYHTMPVMIQESVGEHTYMVLWIVTFLTEGKASAALLVATLGHDTPEVDWGDVPAPTKRAMNVDGLKELERSTMDWLKLPQPELTDEEKRTLKMADVLAGMLRCAMEHRMGNAYIETAYRNFRYYAMKMGFRPHEQDLFNQISLVWEKGSA